MENIHTEKNGLEAVMAHEKAAGRDDLKRAHKRGYDIISKGNGEERHIEVKATGKNRFTRRWLEELEYQALKEDPYFWVYLVTNANEQPQVSELKPSIVEKRFIKAVNHYYFDFS